MNIEPLNKSVTSHVDQRTKDFIDAAVTMGDAETRSEWLREAIELKLQADDVVRRVGRLLTTFERKEPSLFDPPEDGK